MEVKQAVEEYSYAVLELSRGTQRWYAQKLAHFASWCEGQSLELEKIRPSDVRRYVDHLRSTINPRTGKPLSDYTVHGYAQVVKGFLSFCSREDGLEDMVSERTYKRIAMPHVEQKIIEVFTQEHIRKLLNATQNEQNYGLEIRDRAIISVLLDSGVRASELCGLTLSDVFIDTAEAYIRVKGKGRKEREVPLGRQARAILHRYITRFRKAPRGEAHIFLSRSGRPLSPTGVDQMLYRLAHWARITDVRVSCHTFRHSFAVRYLEETGDIYKLSRLLGHTGVPVTEQYLRAVKARDVRREGISVLDALQ